MCVDVVDLTKIPSLFRGLQKGNTYGDHDSFIRSTNVSRSTVEYAFRELVFRRGDLHPWQNFNRRGTKTSEMLTLWNFLTSL